MKRPSRLPVIAAGLAGILLIAFGLYSSRDRASSRSQSALEPGQASLREMDSTAPEPRLTRPEETREPDHSLGSEPTVGTDGTEWRAAKAEPASVLVRVIFAAEETPAAGARVSLWREESGEGAAFRPASRLSQGVADGDGSVSLDARPNQGLEIYAQAPGAGPIARRRIGSVSPGETRTLRIEVERPPAPIDLTVRDGEGDEVVPGAAIRVVMSDQEHLGVEEFPGTAKLIQRTDGEGRAALPGPTRNGKWLLVEAAGYSPTAVNLRSLDGIGASEIVLTRAAQLEVLIEDGVGDPRADIEVQLVTQLGGQLGNPSGGGFGTEPGAFRTTFTAVTNKRGEARFARLPAHTPLVPHAGPLGDLPTLFDAISIGPGEERQVRLSLKR